MKILMVNISDYPIPPPPTVIRADTYISVPLAMELKKRGHNIYFLCPRDSKIKIKKIFSNTSSFASIIPPAELNTVVDMDVRAELRLAFHADVYLKLLSIADNKNFDIIHLHTNIPTMELAFLNQIKTPCVITLHWIPRFPCAENKIISLFNKKKNNYFVSLSRAQQKKFDSISFTATIHNAICPTEFPFNKTGGDDLFFAGRLKQSKGLKEAVKTAIKTKRRLKFTGAVSMSPADQDYLNKEVMPLVKKYSNLLTRLPFTPRGKLPKLYGKSKATLLPIQWEEPFGLVMIESMACGTPIIAFNRGSVPEIIKNGETGFIVKPFDSRGNININGFIEAVRKIYGMSETEYKKMRLNCRKHVEKNFTHERMVDEYEKVYYKILQKTPRISLARSKFLSSTKI